jgi:hypothetical protein
VVEYWLQTREEAVTDRLLFHCGEFAYIESMLQDGGFLLSNNALLELPVSKMKSVDYCRWSIRIALEAATIS